jgi:peptide deformylase
MTEFVKLPDHRIRQHSDEIRDFGAPLQKLVDKLIAVSLAQKDPPALGMAAPQIGVFKRVFVALIRNKFKPFVNPRIMHYGKDETALLEGCFSVHKIYGHVLRPSEVDVVAQDRNGRKMELHLKGLAAKIVQHEFDHLNGELFVDKIFEQNGKLFRIEKDKEGKETLVETTI